MFTNRRHAGSLLAEQLRSTESLPNLVLGLARGGVPVAAVVAEALAAPLDVLVVRKLGVPGHAELAFGAIASGGHRVLVPSVVAATNLDAADIERITSEEYAELSRRDATYRDGRTAKPIGGRTVVIVDDGLATGATARVAVDAARAAGAARIVVAAPVASTFAHNAVAAVADEVVTVVTRSDFVAVGAFYDDFSATSDREVRELIARSAAPTATERSADPDDHADT